MRCVFPLLTCFVLIVSLLIGVARPVSADTYEYLDLADYYNLISVSGNTGFVSYNISYEPTIELYRYSDPTCYRYYDDFIVDVPAGLDAFYMYFMPIGYNYLNITDLIDGSTISFTMNISCDVLAEEWEYTNSVFYRWELWFVDKDGNSLGSKSGETYYYDLDPGQVMNFGINNFDVDIPSGAVYCWPVCYLSFEFGGPYKVKFYPNDMTILADVNLVAKDSQTLDKVADQLADQGKTLDDILTSQEQTNEKLDSILTGNPEDQNAANNFKDEIGDAKDQMADSLDKLDKVERPDTSGVKTDPEALVGEEGTAGAVNILSSLTDFSLCGAQLTVVVGLMLVAYVLHGKKG